MNTIAQSNALASQLVNGNKYRYLYGGKDQPYTSALTKSLASRYPSVYTSSLKALALQDADKGYMAIDCSGFVCKVLGFPVTAMGSSQFRQTAVKKLAVKKENAKPGMAIWRNGHIAYVGDGLKIYEAAGTKADLKVSSWESRASAFTELLVVKGSYLAEQMVSVWSKQKNPYTEPTTNVCMVSTAKSKNIKNYINKGEGVKWVQFELNEAGCKGKDGKPLDVDGKFGANCYHALVTFQSSCKITADGICGATTRKYLKSR